MPPLLILVATNVVGQVHLIKYAYVQDDKLNIYAACPDIPSVTNFNLKHSITNQWWGLGLELHTMIIYNIYIIIYI